MKTRQEVDGRDSKLLIVDFGFINSKKKINSITFILKEFSKKKKKGSKANNEG